MIQRNYISVARNRRLSALRSLEWRDGGQPGWHDWAAASRGVDVGNLNPHQLLEYLVEQRTRAAK
ncbi:MAG: hypothetical protein AB3N11_11410 [Arenibacterium sp.]